MQYYDEEQTGEWDVYHSSVHKEDDKGKEVTVNWKLENFNNNRTFYTDTNGLEIQKTYLELEAVL